MKPRIVHALTAVAWGTACVLSVHAGQPWWSTACYFFVAVTSIGGAVEGPDLGGDR